MKTLMSVADFNARYFAGRLSGGGYRYHALVEYLNEWHSFKGGGHNKNFEKMGDRLHSIIGAGSDILTCSKQPPDSEKRQVVKEIVQQASSELKWLDRKMHMGLSVTRANAEAKQIFRNGVSEGVTKKSGANGNVLIKGDYKDRDTSDNNYWLEFYDPKHRPGFLLHKYWVDWLRKKADCYAMSFWDWLAIQESTDATLRSAINKMTKDASGADVAQNVKYLNEIQRQDYVKTAKSGQLFDCNNNVYDTSLERTHFSGTGWAIYVMDGKNILYGGSHIVGVFHHSSFLGGKATSAAGEMIITNGKVAVLTGKSGHYRPQTREVLHVLTQLNGAGVMLPSAVVKPDFVDPNWYYAWAWQNGAGSAPPLRKDAILKVIPAGARTKASLMDKINAL
jgi:hypothetical protein